MKQYIRVFYRKNLNPGPATLASQVARVVLRLRGALSSMDCVVFAVSDAKFLRIAKENPDAQIFMDQAGSDTCLAYIEEAA